MKGSSEPQNRIRYVSFQPKEVDDAVGDKDLILSLRKLGKLGCFYDRDRTTAIPSLIAVTPINFRTAVYGVLSFVVQQQIFNLNTSDNDTTGTGINVLEVTQNLTNGVMVMLYLKLRLVNYLDSRVIDSFRYKPKVPEPFQIPWPYAFALSQLGQLKIRGLPDELYLSPTLPSGYDQTFGCPSEYPWSPFTYARSVEHAKKIGIDFACVDLSVKIGLSWWLYRPVPLNNSVTLQLPYPEENFPEESAILAGLFCWNSNQGLYNPIIDLDPLGNSNFGSMLRNVPLGFARDVYYAVVEG